MERKFNVKLVRTYKYCPKCTGMMVQCNWGTITVNSTGNLLASNTAGFSSFQNFNHKCDKCGHGENYDKMYPILEYIDDGELG
mgnify:CR=1 FL=1